jgi:cytochrome c oxidase assembly factor CtaG
MSGIIGAAVKDWTFQWGTSAVLLLTGALYLCGFAQLHRQMPERFPLWHLGTFIGGTGTLALAIASPLETLDDRLLTTHMVQHLLLIFVAPPLLMMGAPAIPIIRALPPRVAKRTIGMLARSRSVRRFFRFATHPATTLAGFSVVIMGWHLPGPFQMALRSNGWHAAEHGCFITAGILFWYPILLPWPASSRWPRWAFVPYLLLADGENTVLAAFMVFSERLLYPFYATAPRIGGTSAINDQVFAGAIMWVPGSLLLLIPAIAIVINALEPRTLVKPKGDRYARNRESLAPVNLH